MKVYPTCRLCYLFHLMATKMENRVGVNVAIFRSIPWDQLIVLMAICCKDTNIHENVENKISEGSKCQSLGLSQL